MSSNKKHDQLTINNERCNIISTGKHFEPSIKEINSYKVVMKLTIKDINIADFGTYKCVVKNSLGETDGSIKVYRKCCKLTKPMYLRFLTFI